ncbi:MAG TPA: 4'-phosphopantetheinyl transferase superfamily protein [Propionibacteriaceae bacterium]|nr:4'-phosphopantetheinyl transferase superfamily protein [Propionibacteriaceae bacterium]
MILPADVESEECFGVAPGGALFPEEEKIIAHAVEARRREYAAVRSCAQACLGRLGYAAAPILPGVGGAPKWPAGVQGSMTHCAGYAAAAVGPLTRISAIGIDAEPDAPLPDGVLDLVATAAERNRLAMTRLEPDSPNWDRLLFSAKEAVYKAWFPLVGEWLDHQEAEILFDPQDGTFAAFLARDDLIVDGRQVRRLHGRWVRKRGILVTAVVLGSRDCRGHE